MPIKKTPDITDIIGEKKGEGRREKGEGSGDLKETPRFARNDEDGETQSDFPTHWHTMFNQVFSAVPTIYFSLKETLPKIENNIITVTVKNDIQKEHFEAKTREVLEYLRTNFDDKIDNVVVETNEKLETKKIIYDVKDKLQNFKDHNEEFDDFLQILDLKIKD